MWCLFQQVGGVSGNVDFAVDVETANIDNITIVVQVSTLSFPLPTVPFLCHSHTHSVALSLVCSHDPDCHVSLVTTLFAHLPYFRLLTYMLFTSYVHRLLISPSYTHFTSHNTHPLPPSIIILTSFHDHF